MKAPSARKRSLNTRTSFMAPTATSKTKVTEPKPTVDKTRKSVVSGQNSILNKTFEPKSQNRRMARPGSVADIHPKNAS